MYFLFQPSAEREAAGVNVHLGDTDEAQRRRESQSRGGRALEQQVRQLVTLLQAKGGVVEHASVQLTRLLNLQLVDVAAELHELPGELLVLQAHVRLGGGVEEEQTDCHSPAPLELQCHCDQSRNTR